MNVIYMHTHDSGRYWQPYGYPVDMPHISSLAQEGMLFRNAYCAAPTCSPSRSAMLTGQSAHSSGMLGLTHRGFDLANPQQHLASFLQTKGYETALCGVQHEARDAQTLGYTRLLPSAPGNKGMVAMDLENAQTVASYIREKHHAPFFLSFGMMNTHRPYPSHAGSGINADYLTPPWPLMDNADNRSDMADYYYAAQTVDKCVGEVLRALQEANLMDDTILLMTTDHGIAWPFMKCSLYDTGIGVALIMRIPGMHRELHVSDQLVSQTDIFPTLCDLLHLEKPSWLQGVSLLPVLEKNEAVRSEIFAEVNYHSSYEPKRCVRTERYKLIVRYDDYLGVVATNIDPSPAKDFLRDAGYLDTLHPREELYDLWIDPAERNNLVHDSRYLPVYHDLLSRLTRWMEATDDPLLRYRFRIPRPQGAKISLKTAYVQSDPVYEQD